MVESERWYSPNEISMMLHINVQTIRRAIRAHKLPAQRFGKLWRISDTALQAFMKDKQVEGDPPQK